ncbi:MAG: drug/metabolite transporter (DMT)-like permease [Patiriisocius sp.]|jgi:drug/metabolite transporter (DMT)-like permease
MIIITFTAQQKYGIKRKIKRMNSENNVKLSSWILLIVLTLIWGSSFILIKRGLFDINGNVIFRPDQVGALRITLAGLSLLPIAIYQLRKVKIKDHFWLIMVGLIGNTIPAFLFALAQTKVASAVAGMLNGTTPLFAFIIAVLVFGVKFSKANVMGIAIGFIGMIGLIYFGAKEELKVGYYSFLLVFATACYGLSVNMMKMKLKNVKPITITAISLGYMAVPCAIYLLTTDFTTILQTHESASMAFGYIVILSVIGTTLALVLFNYLVKSESILFASSVTYLIPIVALFWGILDNEFISIKQILSIVVILAGVFLVNKKIAVVEK